jgi:hypothetical protein
MGCKPECGLVTLCHRGSRCPLGRNILSQICLCHRIRLSAIFSVRNPG